MKATHTRLFDIVEKEERATYFSKKITLLNVFLTYMIVTLHSTQTDEVKVGLETNFSFVYWIQVFTQIGVPTFYFISGLLFYRQCKFADIERKLQSRVHSLLVPFLIWNVLTVFVLLCVKMLIGGG